MVVVVGFGSQGLEEEVDGSIILLLGSSAMALLSKCLWVFMMGGIG